MVGSNNAGRTAVVPHQGNENDAADQAGETEVTAADQPKNRGLGTLGLMAVLTVVEARYPIPDRIVNHNPPKTIDSTVAMAMATRFRSESRETYC